MSKLRVLIPVLFAVACSSDSDADAQAAASAKTTCRVSTESTAIPRSIAETSGLVIGQHGILWTHNDSGNDPVLYGLDRSLNLVASVNLTGTTFDDWEDLTTGSCATGHCLFAADIGDNEGRRANITIHELEEPAAGITSARIKQSRTFRYPDRSQDAEAIFQTANGDFYIVTKGRQGPIALYRLPAGQTQPNAVLERVRELFPRPASNEDRVTAASISPDGAWVALRTYRDLRFYPAAALLSGQPVQPIVAQVDALKMRTGESIAWGKDNVIWLTSEAGSRTRQPTIGSVTCDLK